MQLNRGYGALVTARFVTTKLHPLTYAEAIRSRFTRVHFQSPKCESDQQRKSIKHTSKGGCAIENTGLLYMKTYQRDVHAFVKQTTNGRGSVISHLCSDVVLIQVFVPVGCLLINFSCSLSDSFFLIKGPRKATFRGPFKGKRAFKGPWPVAG